VPLPDTTVPYVVVDKVKYEADLPWPVEAAGVGYSLRSCPRHYGNDPINWKAAAWAVRPANSTRCWILRRRRCQRLLPQMITGSRIDLSWSPSSDPQTQVARYIVYRDNIEIGQPTGTSFST